MKDALLYPSVGMRRPQAHLSVNFGQRPFVYDVDGLMAVSVAPVIWNGSVELKLS